MMQGKYIPPGLNMDKFTCPLCHTLAQQSWAHFSRMNFLVGDMGMYKTPYEINGGAVAVSACGSCGEKSLWVGEKMLYPDMGCAPPPNADLPEEVKKIYGEAASILQKSPRAAAALLRLAIDVLCDEQNCKGKNLYEKIQRLGEKNVELHEVIEAMDAVRLVGNAGAHPGAIQINENPKIVAGMFELINYVAEKLITAPKRRADMIGSAKTMKQKKENNGC